MSYKVIKDFTDLQDNNHIYHTGDRFPRDGVDVAQDRLEELASKRNKRKEVLIEEEHEISELANSELHEATEVEEIGEETEPKAKKPEVKKPKDKKPHKTEGKRNKNA